MTKQEPMRIFLNRSKKGKYKSIFEVFQDIDFCLNEIKKHSTANEFTICLDINIKDCEIFKQDILKFLMEQKEQ